VWVLPTDTICSHTHVGGYFVNGVGSQLLDEFCGYSSRHFSRSRFPTSSNLCIKFLNLFRAVSSENCILPDTFPCMICSSISGNATLQSQLNTLAELSGIKSTGCIYSKCIRTSICVSKFLCLLHICMYACMQVCVRVYVCIFVCVRECVHMRAPTRVHLYPCF